MTVEELQIFLEKHNDEFLKFDRVINKLSSRPDIHAFILLNQLFPGNRDMVIAAEHDIIYLAVDDEALARVATPEQIIDLHRCGLLCEENGLYMFV